MKFPPFIRPARDREPRRPVQPRDYSTCGARPPEPPAAAWIGGCKRPAGHTDRHVSDARITRTGPVAKDGYTWPNVRPS